VNLREDILPGDRVSELARILTTGVRVAVRAGEIKTLLFRMAERAS
jgi:hypothetical protein